MDVTALYSTVLMIYNRCILEMNSHPVLLGTTNPAKQRSLGRLLQGLSLDPTPPEVLGLDHREPEEVGDTHEENARLKAQHWSRAGHMMAISSDGGLTIPALGRRWDSLLTRRFAGDEVDDGSRQESLLRLMKPFTGEERRASWVEALAIAEKGRTLASWQVEGASGLLLERPGAGPMVPGFWVFGLWYFPGLSKTYNELTEGELEHIGDHWTQLRSLVQRFFSGGVGPPPDSGTYGR